MLALGLGGVRFVTAVPRIDSSHVAYYNGMDGVTLTGLVVDEPDVRDRYVNLRVRVEELVLPDGTAVSPAGDLLVQTFRFPVIEYGTRVQLNGRLETPQSNPNFDYKAYLARQGIHTIMYRPHLTVLAEQQGNPIYHAIFAFKQYAQTTITHLLPDPQASLLTGILLGNDNGLPPDLADNFRTTGMTHIIAISGFNIAILIAIFVGISERIFSQRVATVVAMSGIVAYTILVGADASVVRAAIMGSIYLVSSRWLGRPNFAYGSLFLAGFLMTLLNPFTLWDVGFQLSFTATLGLMLYADPLTKWTRRQLLRWLDERLVEWLMGLLTEAVILTLAAQVLTLPLMMAYFGQVSLISLPANALILPAQPGVMLWGGMATLAGMVVPVVGQVLAWVAWLFLTYTIVLVRAFAGVPGAAVPVSLSAWGLVGVYGLIAAVTWWARLDMERRIELLARARRNLTQKTAVTISGLAVIFTVSWANGQPDGYLHVAFLDVGQGDAIFIQTPTGRQILVDGGLYPSVLNDRLGRQMPFWDREIDIVVATHPDADHVSGLPGVFERYKVGQLITDGEGMGESAVYDAVLQAAEQAGTPVHRAMAGEVISFGDGVRLEVLHPGDVLDEDNRNENSVSLRLVYGSFSLLLTGDAETKAEQAMLKNGRSLSAIVFKAGHHGSDTSSSRPFLQAVQPQIIVISVGKDNRFGHPHAAMLARAAEIGAAVLRTDELGTIEVITDGQVMWWQAAPPAHR
ncbi:MAG: DNA internalization-related competence protein ComEC/Rec2 [Chloroflexi bacterium]|nr:MAG: DNA internalization-related competence protein ComEC/Rec2 [Chloroflexota bacterium]